MRKIVVQLMARLLIGMEWNDTNSGYGGYWDEKGHKRVHYNVWGRACTTLVVKIPNDQEGEC